MTLCELRTAGLARARGGPGSATWVMVSSAFCFLDAEPLPCGHVGDLLCTRGVKPTLDRWRCRSRPLSPFRAQPPWLARVALALPRRHCRTHARGCASASVVRTL